MTAATATKTRKHAKQTQTIQLRETRLLEFAPLAAGKSRVDAKAGIIFGVKVVGRTSPNTQGQRGAQGTEYSPEALEAALPLYEGVKVNLDHLPRKGDQERPSDERIGKLVNCRIVEGEIYADLHLLKTHPMTARLMEAAESMPDAFALSHHAYGKGPVENGIFKIQEIASVSSVDVVADGGTNSSLFEGRETIKTRIKLKKLLESAKAKKKFPRLVKLLEMGGDAGDVEVEEDEDGESGDERDHLFNAFKALQDKDPEKANKVLGMLKADTSSGDEDTEVEEDDDETPEKPEKKAKAEEAEEYDADGKPKKAQEGRRRKPSTDPHVRELQERLDGAELKEWVRKQCEAKEMPLTDKLLGTLVKLREHKDITDHLDTLKDLGVKQPKAGRNGSAPRSSSPGGRPAEVRESKLPQTADEQAAYLLR
jgi:hypothetical protein